MCHKKFKNSKNKPVKLGVAGIMAIGSLGSVGLVNAFAATATMTILAKLVVAIDITINASMDFGTLAMTPDRSGTAFLDPNVNKVFVNTESSLSLAGGNPRAGQLQIKGASMPVAVSIENTSVKLTNGTTTVSVNNFVFQNAQAEQGNRVTITPGSGDNTLSLALGATLVTKPGQLSGSYIGANRIFANYQ